MTKDKKVSDNIKNTIKSKYNTVTECARLNGINHKYLNNTINKISHGQYPSIKFLKEIAQICNCDFTDFFRV